MRFRFAPISIPDPTISRRPRDCLPRLARYTVKRAREKEEKKKDNKNSRVTFLHSFNSSQHTSPTASLICQYPHRRHGGQDAVRHVQKKKIKRKTRLFPLSLLPPRTVTVSSPPPTDDPLIEQRSSRRINQPMSQSIINQETADEMTTTWGEKKRTREITGRLQEKARKEKKTYTKKKKREKESPRYHLPFVMDT